MRTIAVLLHINNSNGKAALSLIAINCFLKSSPADLKSGEVSTRATSNFGKEKKSAAPLA